MKFLFKLLCTSILAIPFITGVHAADQGNADDAVAMVKKAKALMLSNGKEKAFAEFMNPQGAFHDRDLYIGVLDMNGVTVLNGGNAKIAPGKSMIELKDIDNKYFIKDFITIAKSKGNGWVDYKWPNPSTKQIGVKSTYVEKVDDLIVICGYFKS